MRIGGACRFARHIHERRRSGAQCGRGGCGRGRRECRFGFGAGFIDAIRTAAIVVVIVTLRLGKLGIGFR